jgi:type I restriction enzyme, R subunit
MAKLKAPEIKFQEHIAAFFVREHGYPILEQSDLTDTVRIVLPASS